MALFVIDRYSVKTRSLGVAGAGPALSPSCLLPGCDIACALDCFGQKVFDLHFSNVQAFWLNLSSRSAEATNKPSQPALSKFERYCTMSEYSSQQHHNPSCQDGSSSPWPKASLVSCTGETGSIGQGGRLEAYPRCRVVCDTMSMSLFLVSRRD